MLSWALPCLVMRSCSIYSCGAIKVPLGEWTGSCANIVGAHIDTAERIRERTSKKGLSSSSRLTLELGMPHDLRVLSHIVLPALIVWLPYGVLGLLGDTLVPTLWCCVAVAWRHCGKRCSILVLTVMCSNFDTDNYIIIWNTLRMNRSVFSWLRHTQNWRFFAFHLFIFNYCARRRRRTNTTQGHLIVALNLNFNSEYKFSRLQIPNW